MKPINNDLFDVIDISNNDGNVDFNKVKNTVKAVYIKASEGTTYADPMFTTYVSGLKSNGIPFGCYHWLRTSSAIDTQVKHFWDLIKDCGYSCVPALDWERTYDSNGNVIDQPTPAQALDFLQQFEKLTGIKCMIYGSTAVLGEWINATPDLINTFRLYKIWIAHYGVSEPANNGIWDTYDMWQYSDKGSVDGISGAVDVNKATSSIFVNGVSKPVSQPVSQPQVELLRKGSTGDKVRDLQNRLNQLHYVGENGQPLSIDGTFGDNTDYAVRQFQGDHNLSVDGVVGPNTNAALSTASPRQITNKPTLENGSSGDDVMYVQNKLNALGYRGKNGLCLSVDGDFGGNTDYAIRRFQGDRGLGVDGVVGPQTWTALIYA